MQMFNLLIMLTEATNSEDGFNVKKVRQKTVTHKRKFYINEHNIFMDKHHFIHG